MAPCSMSGVLLDTTCAPDCTSRNTRPLINVAHKTGTCQALTGKAVRGTECAWRLDTHQEHHCICQGTLLSLPGVELVQAKVDGSWLAALCCPGKKS